MSKQALASIWRCSVKKNYKMIIDLRYLLLLLTVVGNKVHPSVKKLHCMCIIVAEVCLVQTFHHISKQEYSSIEQRFIKEFTFGYSNY